MAASLSLPHGELVLPAFLPDATLGVVRAVDSVDLQNCGIRAVVMNTFHLMQHPGSSTVGALGGLHVMSGWPHPIVTDSGGFQAWSLISENPRWGSISDEGITIRPEGSDRKFQLTPEKCVQLQVAYGADVVMCLDQCTHVDDPLDVQAAAVRRTIAWAHRCREEFDRLMKQKRLPAGARPRLFGVVQGGGVPALREECAAALLEIGFDGYGYGGWPLDAEGQLVDDMLRLTRSLIPPHYPMHALGIGHPANIAACVPLGYGIFDSALPTRDARRGRLYVLTGDPLGTSGSEARWYRFLYVTDDKYIKAAEPVDPGCDCLTCTHYSRGYLRHLYRANEAAFQRLATIHNLRFMRRLLDALQDALPPSPPDPSRA
jgi:queuine tRNA-ribosyltransferase